MWYLLPILTTSLAMKEDSAAGGRSLFPLLMLYTPLTSGEVSSTLEGIWDCYTAEKADENMSTLLSGDWRMPGRQGLLYLQTISSMQIAWTSGVDDSCEMLQDNSQAWGHPLRSLSVYICLLLYFRCDTPLTLAAYCYTPQPSVHDLYLSISATYLTIRRVHWANL
jgi:hypothetical protein